MNCIVDKNTEEYEWTEKRARASFRRVPEIWPGCGWGWERGGEF